MKQKIIQGHRLLLAANDDHIDDVIWYYDILHNLNSIPLKDINIMVNPDKNDIKAEINPFMIRDVLTNGRYELTCWFMSYNRDMLNIFIHHKLYHMHDLNIQIDEYPNRIEMSFNNTDNTKSLFEFVKDISSTDSRVKVDVGDDIFTVLLPYEIRYVTDIVHNILYVAKLNNIEYDKKYQYICCPHCYKSEGLIESNSNFDLVGAISTNDTTCSKCGGDISDTTNGYILIDELMYPCIDMMATYKPDIITYGCCQSHPKESEPIDRAYIYGSMRLEIYNFIEAEILNHNETETDLLPISITKENYSDFDYSIGRSLSSDFIKFDISIRNIKTNSERAFMLGMLLGIITKALTKYKESKE